MSHLQPMPLPQSRGFTLVEVMVALIVISVGLLGVVGMEALALSSTTNARMRSLAAIEAAGLAATMHTNRDFWLFNAINATVQGTPGSWSITDSSGQLNVAMPDCTSSGPDPCTPAGLAAYDTQNWAASLVTLLPNPTATISCPNATPPLTCTITIVWVESSVSLSAQQQAAASSAAAQMSSGGSAPGYENNSYTLYVQP